MRPLALLLLAAGALVGDARHRRESGPSDFVPFAPFTPRTSSGRPSSGGSCNGLPGYWTGISGTTPLGDLYLMAWEPPPAVGTWTAVMVHGTGWMSGVGVLGPGNATVVFSFDNGGSMAGNVSSDCGTILWDNGSSWVTLQAIDTVHLVAMNHLDIGYNGIPEVGFINNVLNRYFGLYFPRAIAIAQALHDLGGPERLIYTTHAFLVHLYLHCPNMTLAAVPLLCPSPTEQQAFKDAVWRGDIVWHAAAANIEYENCVNPEMVDVQFQLARDLADELDVPRPKTASLRDVPGTTRGLLPHLLRNNITALSVGVNSGSPAPAMPNPGVWLDPASGASTLFMQTGQGIGYPLNPGSDPANPGGLARDACVTFPGLRHALCWAFRTDNSGPPESPDEVIAQFEIARWQFPGAKVIASTMDAFVEALEVVRPTLPVTTGEAGDTWMTSTTADPVKLAFYRESARAYAECIARGACDIHDDRVLGFSRLLSKVVEHTYGLPGMYDDANWTNTQFAAVIAAGEPAYVNCLDSYVEQREIATRVGLEALGDHPLAADIKARVAALQPAVPDTSALTPVAQAAWSQAWAVGNVTLSFDGATGAITRLLMAGTEWADATHPIAQFLYRTFDDDVYAAQKTCCYGASGRQAIANPQLSSTNPTMTGLWVDDPTSPSTFVVSMSMPDLLHSYYGAPSALWLTARVAGSVVALDLQVFNKTATRLGEAMFLHTSTVPVQGTGAFQGYKWAADKLGTWVDPLDTVANGGIHQHGVSSGVAFRSSTASYFGIDTLDAAVVNPYTAVDPPTMFPQPLVPLTGPVLGFDVQLFQNAFNTNTAQFSFDPAYRWRFRLHAAAA